MSCVGSLSVSLEPILRIYVSVVCPPCNMLVHVNPSFPEKADTNSTMKQEQQLMEDEIKAVISQDCYVFVIKRLIFQAKEGNKTI